MILPTLTVNETQFDFNHLLIHNYSKDKGTLSKLTRVCVKCTMQLSVRRKWTLSLHISFLLYLNSTILKFSYTPIHTIYNMTSYSRMNITEADKNLYNVNNKAICKRQYYKWDMIYTEIPFIWTLFMKLNL